MSLKGKTLFISGGSGGIGLAIARRAVVDIQHAPCARRLVEQ